jgi:Tol biopolymer transport system component
MKGEPLRLTKQASVDFNPVWSPDGRYIAFGRILKGQTGIYIVPASGGAERKVRNNTLWEEQELYEVFWQLGRLSWSPDGRSLAFSDHASRNLESLSSTLLPVTVRECSIWRTVQSWRLLDWPSLSRQKHSPLHTTGCVK